MKKNLSNAFGASLSFGFNDERDYLIDKESSVIKKYAGINIYQPTLDNIETFVRKYVLNELAFFDRTLDTAIQIRPEEMDKANNDYVSEATGTVTIKFLGKEIELPFMISDGELVPFDIIQLNGQRVPYSRENIKKVLDGLVIWEREKGKTHMENPYLGLSDKINPSTTPGFLGSVLHIRDQTSNRQSGPNGNFVYAGEVDKALEKLATMKELTIEDLKKLELELERVAFEEVKEEMEKVALDNSPADDTNIKLFEKMKDVNFKNAYDLPNGTVIAFPEKEDKEIRMTYGIVISEYLDFLSHLDKKAKIVLTQDGRVKIFTQADRLLCFEAPNAKFKIPTKDLDTLEVGDVFMAFDGNKALLPSEINYVSRRSYSSFDNDPTILEAEKRMTYDVNEVRTYSIVPVDNNSSLLYLLGGEKSKLFNSRKGVELNTLEGAKFLELSYSDFIKRKAKELNISEIKLGTLIPKHSVAIKSHRIDTPNHFRANPITQEDKVLVTDANTKVIVIKGTINNYIRFKEDLDKLAFVDEYEDVFEKQASLERNSIKISLRDKDRKVYDADINYVDKSKLMFQGHKKSYKGISKNDLSQLLKVTGYNNTEASEIIYKANNQPQAMFALPKSPNIQALQGAQVTNLAKEKMKNVTKSIVNSESLAKSLTTAVVGTMLADTISKSPDKVQNIAKTLSKFAEEGKALSSSFEKVAIEKESSQATEIAKLMSLSVMFNEKVASTLTGDAVYPTIYEVAKDIIVNSPVLEKTAHDLMSLKVSQYKGGNEVVRTNHIQAAINQLDNLHKVAYAVCEAKYDMNEIEEEKIAKELKDIKPHNVDKAISEVSKRTGIPEDVLRNILKKKGKLEKEAGVRKDIAIGTGGGIAGAIQNAKKLSEQYPRDKEVEKDGVKTYNMSESDRKKMLKDIAIMTPVNIGAGVATTLGTSLLTEAIRKKLKENPAMKSKIASTDEVCDEKLAGAVSGALLGGLYGASDKYTKTVDEFKAQNPGANFSDYEREARKRATMSGIKGAGTGALVGAGVKAIGNAFKSASEELNDRVKEAEMNVPTEEEKKKVSNIATDELSDLDCEVCEEKTRPDEKGYCSKCGTLGGVKPSITDERSTEPQQLSEISEDMTEESHRWAD